MNLERRSWVSEIIKSKYLNRKRLEKLLTKDFKYSDIIDHVNEAMMISYSDVVYIRSNVFKKLLERNGYENVSKFPLNVIMQQLVIDLNDAGYNTSIEVTKAYDIDHNMDIVYPTLVIKLPGGIE